MLLPAVLDSNPFSENHGPERRGGVWKIAMVLDVIVQMTNGQQLHTEVTKQLFMYIFFFCSTSVFNRLFLKGICDQYVPVFMYAIQFLYTLYYRAVFYVTTSFYLNSDAGPTYYNWTAGVRIRANLGELEDWASRNGLDEEFGQLFEKLLTAAELLSTSKALLLKVCIINMPDQQIKYNVNLPYN